MDPESLPRRAVSYAVCATQRSGSKFFCEALCATAVAGVPREYFLHWSRAQEADLDAFNRELIKPWLVPPLEYLHRVLKLGTGPNGVFGIKIMWSHVDTAVRNMRTVPAYAGLSAHEILASVFPNLRYVFMTRADKIRQAVSMAKAKQSGRWGAIDPAMLDDPAKLEMWRLEYPDVSPETAAWLRDTWRAAVAASKRVTLVYDFDQIAAFHATIVSHERAWEAFFEAGGIRPYRVVYEELAAAQDETVSQVLEYLGIRRLEAPPARPGGQIRQSDGINDEWTERFTADLRARGGAVNVSRSGHPDTTQQVAQDPV